MTRIGDPANRELWREDYPQQLTTGAVFWTSRCPSVNLTVLEQLPEQTDADGNRFICVRVDQITGTVEPDGRLALPDGVPVRILDHVLPV